MKKFIDIFGQNNILIIFGIIVLIVVALFIILLIERNSAKKYALEFRKYETKKEKQIKKEIVEEPIKKNIDIEKPVRQIKEEHHEIVYADTKETQEEAKKAIEEAAKKMVYEEKIDIVGPTYFEKVQEENSIISYDELVNSNIQTDYENNLLSDDGNEPITIDELYSLKEENQIEYQEEKEFEETLPFADEINDIDNLNINGEKLDISLEENSYYINSESKKFKNSDVISPVFGVKQDIVYKKEYNELGETVNIKELDIEIKRTEEFLKELKKLKNKLD